MVGRVYLPAAGEHGYQRAVMVLLLCAGSF